MGQSGEVMALPPSRPSLVFPVAVAWLALVCCLPTAVAAEGDGARGVVVDQTGAAVPGATVELVEGTAVSAAVMTSNEGAFALTPCGGDARVRVTMPGFETAVVTCRDAARIVLAVARGSDSATVTATTA